MPQLAPRILTTPHSGIRRMFDVALQADDPIMLLSGDPNFTTPAHIIDAAAEAACSGATGYTLGIGLPVLREAIAERLESRRAIRVGVEEVCVTTGGCGGLFTALLLALEPGDEVLVPDPGWSNYPAMAHALSTTAVGYPLDPAGGFSLDPDEAEARVTPRTRAVIVNTPSNPTGTVETADRLRTLLEVAERHDLWVISDECYDDLVFEGEHVSTATLSDSERVVGVFTFSKSYAMTGWRVGYVVGPAGFVEQLGMYQEPVVTCASHVSQRAALAALRGPQDCIGEMRSAYLERRDSAAAELDARGVGYVRPHGGFFLMADISEAGLDSWTFCRRLLVEEGVAVVPGAAFGANGEGFVRISLAAAPDAVTLGTRKLADFTARLRDGGD
jgi:aspartate/methionine/tyrosine aminotransferase